ncbi:MAG TPA: glycosyltransferase family 39 protein [Pirellulaceae bacterium]|nr:glycosyltransferase family 39 protein [Pirellulaceae bacterium]
MKQLVWHHVLIATVAVLVMFTNLGGAQLWDRDEPRNAGCAEEMLVRGDWVVPFFNGQLRDAKPVMLYWLIMSAYGMFGVGEFAARFWSAALAVGTVLVTYQIGRRLFNPQVGLWAALILSTSLMFDVAGRAATPDSVLIFFVAMALMVYVLGAFPKKRHSEVASQGGDGSFFPQRWPVVALLYAVMGGGILAKGPVALVVPTAVIGMFLLLRRLPRGAAGSAIVEAQSADESWATKFSIAAIVVLLALVAQFGGLTGLFVAAIIVAIAFSLRGDHRWLGLLKPFAPMHFLKTCWHMRPLTALAAALTVALPWFVWVGVETDGEFLRGFFLTEHFGRATTAMENHSGTPLFYPGAILVGFFPWSVFMMPMLIDIVGRMRSRDENLAGLQFVVCWVCVFLGVFTLAETKLPSYITPCYPALALLCGKFLHHWSRGETLVSLFWQRAALASLGLVGCVMLVGLPIAAHRLLPGDEWLGVVGLVPLIAAVVCMVWLWQRRFVHAAQTFAVGAVIFAWVMFGFVTVQVSRHQENRVVLETIFKQNQEPAIASYGCLESTWVFYAKQPITEFAWAAEPDAELAEFIENNSQACFITTDRFLPQLESQLPSEFTVLTGVPYFLKKDRLVLVGRAAGAARTANRKPVSVLAVPHSR